MLPDKEVSVCQIKENLQPLEENEAAEKEEKKL